MHFPFTRLTNFGLTIVAAVTVGGCASVAKVSERRPEYHPAPADAGSVHGAESEIVKSMKQDHSAPLAALGGFITAAETASRELQLNPKNEQAQLDYNFAVGRIIETVKSVQSDPWAKPLSVPTGSGGWVLTHKPDKRQQWNPALYDFTPANQYEVSGTYITEHTIRPGIGAPVVAVGREINKDSQAILNPPRFYYGLTAVARFEGRQCVVDFEDPLESETTRFQGRTVPMAADFTVPIAVMLAANDSKKMGVGRALNPGKYDDTARVLALQPYDPNKTVVLFVHGLMSSQSTWIPMINHLRGDPEIRRKYQFWFYTYPSGYPFPYPAAILRQELDKVERRTPLRHKMVVVGHSMGGCISRLLITDAGEKLWMDIFKKPPAEVEMSPASKQLISESLIFEHRPEIGRVVFIDAPLKGSELATDWIGRLGSFLVKSPTALLNAGNDALKDIHFQSGELALKEIPNSVDTLAPNNRFVMAMNTIPVTPGIPYHIIGGDQGKGGNKNHTKPVMSDGVVPYWSYHMDGAQSELIVPSGHGAHQNPLAINEVERILKLNER